MIQLGETNIRYMSRRDEFSGSKQERRVSGGGGKNLYHEGKKRMEKSRVPAGKLDLICKIIPLFKGVKSQ